MATLNIYKLHFTSSLHIGDRKQDDYSVSQKSISSDSLYAAITSVLAKSGTTIPQNGYLGCAISSLFPYYQKGKDVEPVYFLPQPLMVRMPEMKDIANRKRLKKVRWIDARNYSDVLAGQQIVCDSEDSIRKIQGKYFSETAIEEDFICSQVVRRMKMQSRVYEDDPVPYYVDQISFKGESGLYFIVDGDCTLLEKGLRLLSLEGIGTDRNVGNGFFEYEKSAIKMKLPIDARRCVNLSLFIPESKEQLDAMIDAEDIAYDIERRGGWITTYPFQNLRKNVIYGFTPGSVFSLESDGIETRGRIVDLQPDVDYTEEPIHPIWRSGKALFLPIII